MTGTAESTRIRAARPPKPRIDAWRPLDVVVEAERGREGRLERSVTVFLAGSECPFTCVFCDLWRYTLDEPTPPGSIPRQIEIALDSLSGDSLPECVKLYNASNFFDKRAVPPQDLAVIAGLLIDFERVVVECHPRLVDESCIRFAQDLDGKLEVAMGLETVHPEVLPRLNKQMTLEQFESAAQFLREHEVGIRAFVLLSPPFLASEASVEWAVRSVHHAWKVGADVVSVIPMRSGNGEMDRLAEKGLFVPPTLAMLEETLVRVLESDAGRERLRGIVQADLWDAERLSACPECRAPRLERLRTMNRTGVVGLEVDCPVCRSPEGGAA